MDIHRVVPGVGLPPEEAFEKVWAEHKTVQIAEYPCAVPSADHQMAVIILHEARSGATRQPDVDHIRAQLSEEQRLHLRGIALLKARLQTEQSCLKRAELIAYAATPNLDHLRLSLHREPTAQDVLQDLSSRWTRGLGGLRRQLVTDLTSRLTHRRRGPRS
ncbi:hypothetical protein AB0E44_11360 [Micrococcus terreus]|uniref:hypothetical protein n=1 Tax=Micrococcus terreus TaxID=574650 RepID=UPI00340676B6